MKTLILQRHARAESSTASDFERKLSAKGKDEAAIAATLLLAKHLPIDVVYVSPAKRATKTAKIFAKMAEKPKSMIEKVPLLYQGGCDDILKLLQNMDPKQDCLYLIGHNPALLELTDVLSSHHIRTLKPAEAVILEFDIPDWQSLSQAHCCRSTKITV